MLRRLLPVHFRAWVLIGCVPAVATAVAARQIYLSKLHELSTWKGGGMGMFASADGSTGRFAKLYIETPDGQRQPVVKLTPGQQKLLASALWYPVNGSFRDLAASIRRTNWAAPEQQTPVHVVNAEGKRVRPAGKSYYSLYPLGERPKGNDPDWTLAIEYWNAAFDPATRLVQARHVWTLRYAKGEL